MNEVEVFNFEANEVRTVIIDNEAWFVGKDVAQALGYQDTPKAIKQHVDPDDRLTLTGQNAHLENLPNRGVVGVNESGVYSLIFGSKLESAKRFKKWVTSEVLPAIRKTGSYTAKPMSELEQIALIAKGTTQLSERIEKVDDKLNDLIDNQPLNATDYGSLNRLVNHRVYAYASIHHIPKSQVGPLFKDLGNQIKQVAGVGNRSRIKSKDYDMVIQFVDNWEPSTATKTIIEQTSLDVRETA